MLQLLENKRLFGWLLGVLFITIVLWVTVLRYPGYIYYWDLSGAFSYRNPFEQYFFTNSPYDGVEVGLKQRLPIVSIIFVVSKIISFFGVPMGEVAIKVAVWLMFTGAFSAFYYILPNLDNLFSKKQAALDRTNSMNIFFQLGASLFYMIIPMYTYRISQLHLFYFTLFYPLIVYFWILFLQSDRSSWKKYAVILVFLFFFGTTTPHSIVYYGLSLTVLFIGEWSRISWSFTWLKLILVRIGILGSCILLTQLYWIIPYLLEGTPSPGYVVSTDMISFLSQNSNSFNFFADISEWYMGQSTNLGAISSESIYVGVQYVGILSLYGFSLYYLNHRFKSSKVIRWISFLLLIVLFVSVKDFPWFTWLYEKVSFSNFGWLLREPNRIRVIWAFWIYTFSVLGLYRYVKISHVFDRLKFLTASVLIVLGVSIISYSFYVLPVFKEHLQYLRPGQFAGTFTEVTKKLEEEKYSSWGGVYTYPRIGGYGIPWKQKTFAIADETEYLFLPYNLPIPPVQRASVLASGQSIQDVLGEEFFHGNIKFTAQQLYQLGIQYFLVTKGPLPLSEYTKNIDKEIVESIKGLKGQASLSVLVENSQYVLFRVNYEAQPIAAGQLILSNTPLSFYSDINLTKGEIIYPVSEYPLSDGLDYFIFQENEPSPYSFLDYLTETVRNRYTISLVNDVTRHASPIDWGRMSLKNLVNGESKNINFINGVRNFERDKSDIVLYSDSPRDSKKTVEISIPSTVNCVDSCSVYAKVLMNVSGGNMSISVNSSVTTINTRDAINRYRWVKLGELSNLASKNIIFRIVNSDGYQVIVSTVVIPNDIQARLITEWQNKPKLDINSDSGNAKICEELSVLRVSNLIYRVSIQCTKPSVVKFPVPVSIKYPLFVSDVGQVKFLNINKPMKLSLSGYLYQISLSTVILWIGFIITIPTLIVLSVIYYKRSE